MIKKCPHCGEMNEYTEDKQGKKVNCKVCRKTFFVSYKESTEQYGPFFILMCIILICVLIGGGITIYSGGDSSSSSSTSIKTVLTPRQPESIKIKMRRCVVYL